MNGRHELQQRLASCGITSTTWLSVESKEVATQILDRRGPGELTSPVVLMGYAVGGGGVREVAEILKKNEVRVDAVILIDPSFFEPVSL